MPDVIPNLWPAEFKVDVQTPYAILRVQANLLRKVTRGILEGDVETEISKIQVQHRLVVVAPAWNGFRYTLIVVRHDPELPYPAEVRAECLGENRKREGDLPKATPPGNVETEYPTAYNDEQMLVLVQRVLSSQPTMAVILSLIARSKEADHSTENPSLHNHALPSDEPGKQPC